MTSSKKKIFQDIEEKKSQLNKAVNEHGLNSDTVLKISQEMDELLNLYYINDYNY